MRKLIGLAILGVVAVVALVATQIDLSILQRNLPERRDPVALRIFYGGEKRAFLANPRVAEIVSERFAIDLDARKAGSIEMVTSLDSTGMDCLWPSNMIAVELARKSGKPVVSAETVFNSPIVFYAWADVADAFETAGIVRRRNDGFLAADVAALGMLLAEGQRWRESFGLNIFGPVKVFSTDPTKSNSGNIWLGLLATIFNDGAVPDEAALTTVLPKLEDYFGRMGYMESSSGDIFASFLKQGMGARPIIVGYENQMVEFLIENAQAADLIRQKIRVIYPEPTIYASHPLIALTPECRRLEEALLDPEVQAIAWADHGFRTGLLGVENDPAALETASLPEAVSLVVPMPTAEVMTRLLEEVR
ncbi:MAG: hypothetical protein AAF074_15410 [Pseudomonadota bacterium]